MKSLCTVVMNSFRNVVKECYCKQIIIRLWTAKSVSSVLAIRPKYQHVEVLCHWNCLKLVVLFPGNVQSVYYKEFIEVKLQKAFRTLIDCAKWN